MSETTATVRVAVPLAEGTKLILGTQDGVCPALIVFNEEAYGFTRDEWEQFVSVVKRVDSAVRA